MSEDYLAEGFKEVMLSALIAVGTLGLNDVSDMVVGADNLNSADLRKLASNTSIRVYEVESGDSLSKIVNKFGVKLQDILTYNHNISNPNKISVGQKIIIPSENIANITSTQNSPTINNKNPIHDSKFIDFVKSVENSIKAGWKNSVKMWYPHRSPEGGNDTIAYGHKLKDSEVLKYKHGLSNRDAMKLLISDLRKAEQIAKHDLKWLVYHQPEHYKLKSNSRKSYDELGPTEKQMAIEFAFNLGGLKKFPTFFTALLNGDSEKMKQEYQRSYSKDGQRYPVKERNEQFYNYFLKNYEPNT